jgi:hypothetical protein
MVFRSAIAIAQGKSDDAVACEAFFDFSSFLTRQTQWQK